MQMTAEQLVQLAKQNPMGFTVDTNGIHITSDYTRYVIGLKETKDSHNLEGARHCTKVMEMLLEHEVYPKHRVGFGGWLDTDTNTFHFDVVTFSNDKTTALMIAVHNKQLAIFDLQDMKEIKLV